MVDVQQRALGALEQDPPAVRPQAVQFAADVAHHVGYRLRQFERARQNGREIQRRLSETVLQHETVVVDDGFEFLRQRLLVEQVRHADAPPRGLVLVGRADATAGGADGLAATGLLARLVQLHVVRHDHRAGR